ncbi:MAG TPA: hypothetical protein VK168_14145 [Saprospiraceae bacterium]|nr:hypothetical protein [Saprospiraceae bacterium]
MNKDDATRKKFAERFEDFEAEPQEKSWEIIRDAIRPKRKKRALWLFFGWGCLALLIGAISWCWFQKPAAGIALHQATEVPAQECIDSTPSPVPEVVAIQEANRSQTLPGRSGISEPAKPVPAVIHQQNVSTELTDAKLATDDKALFVNTLQTPLAQLVMPEAEVATIADLAQTPGPVSLLNLPGLPIPPFPIHTVTKQHSIQASQAPVLKTDSRRKGVFFAEGALLSTYQIMQAQTYKGLSASDFSTLPSLDGRRLGATLALGYRQPIFEKAEIHAAIRWINLPYRTAYTVSNTHQLEVEILPGAQYRVAPKVLGEVTAEKRLNYWGLQLDYGRHYRLFNHKIRVYVGGESLWREGSKQPDFWALAGVNIPLGLWRMELAPVFSYQLNRIEQADHLIKTRLYTLGLGIKTTF